MIKSILPDGPTPFSLKSERLPNFNPIRVQSRENRVCRCGGSLSIGRIKGSCRGRCSACGRYFDLYGRNMGDLRAEKVLNGLNMADKRAFSWVPAWMRDFPEAVIWKLVDTGLFSGNFCQIFESLKLSAESEDSNMRLEGSEWKSMAKFRQSCWVFPLETAPGFVCGALFHLNDGRNLRVHVRGRRNPAGAESSETENPYFALRYCPEGLQVSLLDWSELYETCFDDLSGFSLSREVVLHLKQMKPKIVNFRLNNATSP